MAATGIRAAIRYSEWQVSAKEIGELPHREHKMNISGQPGLTPALRILLLTAGAVVTLWGMSTYAAYINSAILAVMIVLVMRTSLEDSTLYDELPGYDEYAQTTRSRLLPGVW